MNYNAPAATREEVEQLVQGYREALERIARGVHSDDQKTCAECVRIAQEALA